MPTPPRPRPSACSTSRSACSTNSRDGHRPERLRSRHARLRRRAQRPLPHHLGLAPARRDRQNVPPARVGPRRPERDPGAPVRTRLAARPLARLAARPRTRAHGAAGRARPRDAAAAARRTRPLRRHDRRGRDDRAARHPRAADHPPLPPPAGRLLDRHLHDLLRAQRRRGRRVLRPRAPPARRPGRSRARRLGVPLLVATGLALAFGTRLRAAQAAEPHRPQRFRSAIRARGIWAVTGFFGAQALIYFSLTAWLPTIAADRGMPPADAGLLLAWMSVAGLPASLVAPTLASRRRLRVPIIAAVSCLSAIGLAGLAFAPLALAPLMVAVLGIAQSAAFGLGIALIVFTAPSAAATATFSALSQGIGYAAAATGPLLLGLLAQLGLSWAAILSVLLIAAAAEAAFGITAARASAPGPEPGAPPTASPSS
ncbi:MFS transporter [Leucobacter sp. HNU]|uniref:MFS transporter n=1 Tax=Leucobacter sp. HNU TaxID=3236805 RepID=UPI003A7F8FFB